jgi:VIT1/CCC1 family predicted Fe2+/Mn2+ transporter
MKKSKKSETKQKRGIKKGFSFGLTSGIITTLGLIVGLHSGTHERLAVIGGILIIAIADAFSDALGIHISEEDAGKKEKEVWRSTIATFFTKFIVALTFMIPILLFSFTTAIWISIFYGLIILGIFSYIMAKRQNKKPRQVIFEHLLIMIVVIIVAHFVGDLIGLIFGAG